jgi:hypothetical protein
MTRLNRWMSVAYRRVPCILPTAQMLQKICQHPSVNGQSATQQIQGFSEGSEVHQQATEIEEVAEQSMERMRKSSVAAESSFEFSMHFSPFPDGFGNQMIQGKSRSIRMDVIGAHVVEIATTSTPLDRN